MSILLDTNVLLRMEDSGHAHHVIALESIERLNALQQEFVLVPQVLYEFWVVATRPVEVNGLGLDVSRVDQIVVELSNYFRLLLDERRVFAVWRHLVTAHDVKGKTAHDARLVAAMRRHGVSHLLTFNQPDFSRFTSITAISPPDVVAGNLPVGFI